MKKLIICIMVLLSVSFTALKTKASDSYYKNAIGRTMNIITGGPTSINFEHQILTDAYLNNMVLLKDDTPLDTSNTITSQSFSGISQSISTTFGLGLDIDGTYKGIRGEISTGYNEAGIESTSELYSHFYYYKYVKLKRYSLFITNIGYQNQNLKNNLTPEFLQYLNDLKNGNYSYSDFFDRFGTHLIISGEFGGKLEHKYSMYTNEIAFNTSVTNELKTSISASVPLIGSANLNSTSGFNNITSVVEKTYYDSDVIIRYGGVAYQGNYYNWLNSLTQETSRLIGFTSNSLVPLWDLLPTQYLSIRDTMISQFNSYYSQKMSEIYDYYTISKYSESTQVVSYIRGLQYTITDTGRQYQPYDIVFNEIPIEVLKGLGYSAFSLSLSGKYWESDDGFQYIFVYATPNINDTDYDLETEISQIKYEHSPGKPSSTKKDLIFQISPTSLNVFPLNTDGIIIRYGASGFQTDVWYNSDIVVTITFYK